LHPVGVLNEQERRAGSLEENVQRRSDGARDCRKPVDRIIELVVGYPDTRIEV
jgi:hypothetical protein